MKNIRVFSATLLVVVSFFLVTVLTAQVIPMPTGITCVPVPGIPCPGSSILSGGLSPNQQITGSLIEAFINMLFSTNSKDDEQKRQMMAELERRRAEAERQHRYEEAMKLAAICSHLEATLKLSGVPSLQLKTSDDAPSSGLQLKLGDGNNGHVGIKGLPGIALNDNTGNGGSTPYGIQGLPGIYVNGPASLPSSPGLSLKIGDSETAPAPADASTAANSPSGDVTVANGAAPDVLTMSPQQLADVAEKVNNLPPEQLQRLMDAGRSASQVSSPATLQLQQNASSSQTAVTAGTPEGASTLARTQFDNATAVKVIPGTSQHLTLQTSSAPSLPSASSSASVSSLSKPSYVPTVTLPVDAGSAGMANLALGAPIIPAPAAASRIPTMTNEQLKAELCRSRNMLVKITSDSRKDSHEMDAMAKEVEATRKEAVVAGVKCFTEMLESYIDTKMEKAYVGDSFGAEKEAREHLMKVLNLGRDIEATSIDYNLSEKQREEKLDSALGYLTSVYDYVEKADGLPGVPTVKCAIDFSYLATKVYLEQEQIEMMNDNQTSDTGALKAESSVAGFHKKLVDESLRRGMDPKTACH
jgi:hypothetical protein